MASRRPRIGLDGTPLLGRRTGIGVYTDRLIDALLASSGLPTEAGPGADAGFDLSVTAFTARGGEALTAMASPTLRVAHRPVPARLLRMLWAHSELPSVRWLAGRLDLFHATNFVLPPVGSAAGVVTIHDLAFLHSKDTVDRASSRYRGLVPRSLQRAAVICTPTHAVAEEVMSRYGVEPDRLAVTPLGVDQQWARARPLTPDQRRILGVPADYVVAVGTLEPRKNLVALVQGYGQARAADPDLPVLVLVGAPGWGPALQLDAVPPGSVITTGYLADEQLRSLVAGARALVFPSRYEGFGLPPLEALACGVAVVANDIAATREVLGTQAELVDVNDPDALAAGLSRALRPSATDDAARERRRAYAAGWTWSRCAAATLEAYRRALD